MPFVAIVEDDVSLLRSLVSLLASYGYEVGGYESAEQMLVATKDRVVACVLTDIQMSGMDGFALARVLRAETPMLPIIMLTANANPVLEERACELGILCVLHKPMRSRELIGWLEVALTPLDRGD